MKHRYAPMYRPPSFNCLPRAGWELLERPAMTPNNFERRQDLPVSSYQFGVIAFDSQLSKEDEAAYDLTYLGAL
jgi:hypothetical protein